MKLKTLIAVLALAAAGTVLVTGPALAAEPPAAPSATPVKHPTLKSCNRQATARQLAGRQREQFVKECLAAKTAPAPPPTATSH